MRRSSGACSLQEFRLYAMRNPEAMTKLAALQRADMDAMAQLIATERQRFGIDLPEPPSASGSHCCRTVLGAVCDALRRA